jgi:hypothetical protein
MESRGNDVSLGGIEDHNLIFLFPKGICVWLDKMGDPQAFGAQQWRGGSEKYIML